MAVETAEDREAMLADFGIVVTLPSATTITGILDSGYLAVDVEDTEVESSEQVLTCRTTDVSALTHGSQLTISGATYYVRGIQPDGTGITTLILDKG